MRLNKLVYLYSAKEKYWIIDNYNGRIGKIDEELYFALKNGKFNKISPNILEDLKNSNIIVEDDFDEFKYYDEKILKIKNNTSTIVVTLVLTRNCNFACVYCYEKENKGLPLYMSSEVIDATYKFLKDFITKNDVKKIDVIFYGGEPLLNFEGMKYAVNKFKKLEYIKDNLKVEFEIITNGYLITEKIATFIKNHNLKRVQITFDGPPDIHNRLRPLKGGGKTFERILKNIILLNKSNVEVAIRSNLYTDTVQYYPLLLDILEENNLKNDNIILSPAQIQDVEELKKRHDFSIKFIKIINEIRDRGFKLGINPLGRKIIYCSGISKSSYVIDYNGKILTCPGGIGIPDFEIGDVFNGIDTEKHKKFLNLSPLSSSKCRECPIIGFCGGGCMKEYHTVHGEINIGECTPAIYDLDDYLNLLES